MKFHLPKNLAFTPSNFTLFYAAYHGLAYYTLIIGISSFLFFDKGIIRFGINVLLFILAFYIFLKNRNFFYKNNKKIFSASAFIFSYFIWTGLSFFWADSYGVEVRGLDFRAGLLALWANCLLEFLIVFLMVSSMRINELAEQYIKGLAIGGVILSVTLLCVKILGLQTEEGRLGFFIGETTIIRPNWAAMKLAISMMCMIHLFLRKKVCSYSWYKYAIGAMLILITLLLTIGKTAIIGFVLAFIVYFAVARINFQKKILLIGFVCLVSAAMFPLIQGYLNHYIEHGTYLTLTDRTELWEKVLEEIWQRPLFGHGVGTPLPKMYWSKISYVEEAHNEYLNALFSTGVIGFMILLLMIMSLVWACFVGNRSLLHRRNAPLGFSILILFFVFSITASSPVGFFIPLEFQLVLILWFQSNGEANSNIHFIENRSCL